LAERAFTHPGIESKRVRGMGTAAAFQRSPLLHRRINEVMREGRRDRTDGEEIPFFCECQRTDCHEPIWLTAAAYDERRTEARIGRSHCRVTKKYARRGNGGERVAERTRLHGREKWRGRKSGEDPC
jgi:hypothetical protein